MHLTFIFMFTMRRDFFFSTFLNLVSEYFVYVGFENPILF